LLALFAIQRRSRSGDRCCDDIGAIARTAPPAHLAGHAVCGSATEAIRRRAVRTAPGGATSAAASVRCRRIAPQRRAAGVTPSHSSTEISRSASMDLRNSPVTCNVIEL
jgi:hypothetical protein